MSSLPSDLVPIPTAPYDERPDELPLDLQECRTALWMARGNVTEAAATLKVTSMRLRRFIKNSAYLTAEQDEARERIKDKAESVVVEALEDVQDPGRRDSMARFVLAGQGRDRGYGNGAGGVTVKGGSGPIHITWGGGMEMLTAEEPQTIDVTPNKAASNG